MRKAGHITTILTPKTSTQKLPPSFVLFLRATCLNPPPPPPPPNFFLLSHTCIESTPPKYFFTTFYVFFQKKNTGLLKKKAGHIIRTELEGHKNYFVFFLLFNNIK